MINLILSFKLFKMCNVKKILCVIYICIKFFKKKEIEHMRKKLL
jgi:hypothetical protein